MIASELDLERPLIFELPAVFTTAECACVLRIELPVATRDTGTEYEARVH